MNKVMKYVVACSDRGDLRKFLRAHSHHHRWYIYRGACGLDLHVFQGKILRVSYCGKFLQLVEV